MFLTSFSIPETHPTHFSLKFSLANILLTLKLYGSQFKGAIFPSITKLNGDSLTWRYFISLSLAHWTDKLGLLIDSESPSDKDRVASAKRTRFFLRSLSQCFHPHKGDQGLEKGQHSDGVLSWNEVELSKLSVRTTELPRAYFRSMVMSFPRTLISFGREILKTKIDWIVN